MISPRYDAWWTLYLLPHHLYRFSGYMIPQPSMIGALKWITYINPFRWGFEALITNEFRTIDGYCEGLIPQGPGYENVNLSNQVCPTVGAVPGRDHVDGNRFTSLSFGYSFSHTWRNFGIIIAFTVSLIWAALFFTEWNTRVIDSKCYVYKMRSW
ncbi:hypothetical protein MPER_04924, partial [Moniliophthora perniciosa FA553]